MPDDTIILFYGEKTETGINIYKIQLEEPISEESKSLVIKNTAMLSLVINDDEITYTTQNQSLLKKESILHSAYAINDTLINFFTRDNTTASDLNISQPSINTSLYNFICLTENALRLHIKRDDLRKTKFKAFMNNAYELIIKDPGRMGIIKIVNLKEKTSFYYTSNVLNGFYIRKNITQYDDAIIKNDTDIDKNSFKNTYLDLIPKKDVRKAINILTLYPYAEQYIKALVNESIKDWYIPQKKDAALDVDAVMFINRIINNLSKEEKDHYNIYAKDIFYLFNRLHHDDAKFIITIILNHGKTVNSIPNNPNANANARIIVSKLRNAGKIIKHIVKKTPDAEKTILQNTCCYNNTAFKAFVKRIFKELKTAKNDYETALYLSLFFNKHSLLPFVFTGKDKDGGNILSEKRTLLELINLANNEAAQSRQYDVFAETIRLYNDTLQMANVLIEENIIDSIPNDISITKIQNTHDRLVKIFNQHKMIINEARFKHARDSYKKFLFEDETFTLRLPDNNDDFVKEGIALHHCVASYTNAFLENRSAILFIRNKDNPDVPYYTMEVNPKTRKIVQVKGKHNTQPPKEVNAFVKKIKSHYQTDIIAKNDKQYHDKTC